MTQQIKLLLAIPHLGGGGAERITAQLAQHLDPDRFQIHLALMTPDRPGSQQMPEWVTVHRFKRTRVRQAWWQILKLIWRERPDAVLSNMAHLNFLVLSLKPLLPSGTSVLVRQNTIASGSAPTWLGRIAYRFLYPHADAIVCQSQGMTKDLAGHFHISRAKMTMLANPVDIQAIRVAAASSELSEDSKRWPKILGIGRLSHEKGFDLLLRAMVAIRRVYPQVQLNILGVGSQEKFLRQLSHELAITDLVKFPGYISNPAAYFAGATLFVLPSRWEGVPNALLEAAAACLPIVATPCEGIRELLRGEPGTWVAREISSKALEDCLLQAISTLAQPPSPPERFTHPWIEPFALATTVGAYARLIEKVADEAQR